MHIQAHRFMLFCKSIFPSWFVEKHVLDVGSGDINGNNRSLFERVQYHGNDVYAAKNVTIVSKTSALTFEDGVFDTIVSTECFEHDPEWKESLQTIVRMLKPGGLFCFTCASTGRAEHGTRRTSPQDSYGTIGNVAGWTDYYKNLTIGDVRSAIDVDSTFIVWDAYYNSTTKDLYFYGVKRGGGPLTQSLPIYRDNGCSQVK